MSDQTLSDIPPQQMAAIKADFLKEDERLERSAWRMMAFMAVRNILLLLLLIAAGEMLHGSMDEVSVILILLAGSLTSILGTFWSRDYIKLHRKIQSRIDDLDPGFMADFRARELHSLRRSAPALALNFRYACLFAGMWTLMVALFVYEVC